MHWGRRLVVDVECYLWGVGQSVGGYGGVRKCNSNFWCVYYAFNYVANLPIDEFILCNHRHLFTAVVKRKISTEIERDKRKGFFHRTLSPSITRLISKTWPLSSTLRNVTTTSATNDSPCNSRRNCYYYYCCNVRLFILHEDPGTFSAADQFNWEFHYVQL